MAARHREEMLVSLNVIRLSDKEILFLLYFYALLKRGWDHNLSAMGSLQQMISKKDCQNIVQQIRSTSVAGCPMLGLQKKLKALKTALIERNKSTVGNVSVQVAQLQENLKFLQQNML
ncbi:hypothetical protein PHAVU_009G190764 [Phaseolus vulgaris]|uniref:Uncharacterized protein n=1 Tax=Phaseolus vulgaris TaxID=3885 RepID=V7CHR4_PHAVU|nr:hypothetical protein PHAVU_002G087200g [Phaseolus vulgaris]ESW29644.1 hypothetical protein PHAVU_002G087200g [Phaseolus vulgaris]